MFLERASFDVVRDRRGELLGVGDLTPNGEGYISELDRGSDLIAVMTPGGEQGFRSAQLELSWFDTPRDEPDPVAELRQHRHARP